MKASIVTAKELGADGLVLGILKPDNSVDVRRTRELVSLGKPLPVTFHRAFDDTADLSQALDDVVQTGAARILTSGGAASALEGAARISRRLLRRPLSGSRLFPARALTLTIFCRLRRRLARGSFILG